jgi:hypothetical protein
MTDKNHSCEKEFEKSGVKFPCGSFEKMLKAFRQCSDEKTGKFDFSAIMKKFSESAGDISGCAAIMQNLCSSKEGPIDCKAIMKDLFGNGKMKTEHSE